MGTVKDFRFPVVVERSEGLWITALAPKKHPLTVATPPEFRGGIEGYWSPEELLVAAVASCYQLTLRSIADRRLLDFSELEVRATGHVTQLARGRIGFLAIELDVRLEVELGEEGIAEAAARKAHELCIVGQALDVPVELKLELRVARVPAMA
ncbi:MAG TPA: OsmC family protein [Gaiellaceae bacterium]|nr:OsmC family protein [Gaiellaceae bacterium]